MGKNYANYTWLASPLTKYNTPCWNFHQTTLNSCMRLRGMGICARVKHTGTQLAQTIGKLLMSKLASIPWICVSSGNNIVFLNHSACKKYTTVNACAHDTTTAARSETSALTLRCATRHAGITHAWWRSYCIMGSYHRWTQQIESRRKLDAVVHGDSCCVPQISEMVYAGIHIC